MNTTLYLIALIPPLLYGISNQIDKTLLSKYFNEGGVGTLIIISALLSIVSVPFVFLVDPTVLNVDTGHLPVLAFAGLLNVGLIWFYLRALNEDEPAVVIVFYQLVPVLGLLFGYTILGETINQMQLIAMGTILLGTSIVSFELQMEERGRLKFRAFTVFNMLGACTCWALETAVLKKVALEENIWRSLFWEQSMMVLVGILILIFIPAYRITFLRALKENSKKILFLNASNEVLYIIGNIIGAAAAMLAPIALILLAQPFQSIFVFVIGIMLTSYYAENKVAELRNICMSWHTWQKLLAIAITCLGSYLLLSS